MPRRSSVIVVLLCALAFASGCSVAGSQDPEELQGRLWTCEQVRVDSGLADAPDGALPTLLLEGATAGGFTGVNRFEGSYTADAESLTIRPELSAKVVGIPQLMATEAAYLLALDATRTYRVREDALELVDGEGEVVASFVEADGALEANDWACTGIGDGRRGITPTLESAPISARFEDGTMSGSTGVNDYEAGYESEADALSLDSAAATTKRSGTEAALAQERAYLEVLPRVVRFHIADDVLTLYDGQSAPLATFEALAP